MLNNIFNGGEENIINETSDLVHLAMKANKELLKRVKIRSNDISEIKRLEKESDKKVFALQNMVSSGAVSPNVIDDMLKLIDLEDNIVDCIYNLARELVRYKLPNKAMDDMLRSSVIKSLELTSAALVVLEKMQLSDDTTKMQGYRKEIEVIEEEGDEIKDSLLDYVYKNKMEFKAFNHISEVAHKTDNILDNCEDSSDMFLSIMLSIMT